MSGIESWYNKHFRNIVDKVALGAIITYGVMVIMLVIIRNDTFEKTIVNSILNNISWVLIWSVGIIPMIRYYKIIFIENVLENITPKSYKERFLEGIKIYGAMICMFIFVLTIHKLILPIIAMDFDGSSIFIYSFAADISTLSFFIMLGLFLIMATIHKNQQKKINKLILIGVVFFVVYFNDKIKLWINNWVYYNLSSMGYFFIKLSTIGFNIFLSFIFIVIILKEINRVNVRKIDI